MSWLMISKCFQVILVDPSLLQLFQGEELRSIPELPFLGALCFWVVSERLFAHLASPSLWGKVRMEFITDKRWNINGEIIPMGVLVTDEVEEGSGGMLTTFCHHDQVKVEPLEVLSTLVQWNAPELSIVVVKIFTNSSCLPWESFGFPYPDVTILSAGASTAQFPQWLGCTYAGCPLILPIRSYCCVRRRKRG